MALNLYLGSSGAGKSYQLYQMIAREAAADLDRNFLLVVPEQFTLQTQRDMIAMSPTGGIMNIDVLSFPRMAHRIFEELGVKTPVTLEDTGKTMIVKKVALDRADKLGVYAGKIHRRGFIQEMKSLIAEFYQYGIGPDELERMIVMSKERPRLSDKLSDISEIYDGFREFINGRFIMNEELLELFVERAPESAVLKGACVCFDGFTGFTVMQLRCIECLMNIGCEIYITVTVDPASADKLPEEEDLFCLSEKTIEKLVRLADNVGCAVKRHIIAPAINPRFAKSTALASLEKNIFRRGVTAVKEHDGITAVSCESPAAEVRYLISTVRRLAAKEGYRYGQIGVIVGDMEIYGRIADREFTKAGIPFFIDRKKNILGTAPVEMLRAVLEIAANDFAHESVFRFLKTGLTGLEQSEIEKLENYCSSRAVRGRSMWRRQWTGKYKSRYEIDLDAVNATRKKVFAILDDTVDILCNKKSTVVERTDALKGLLDRCKVRERLEAEAEAKKESPEYVERLEGLEAAQLPEKIDEVFERICLLLGDDVMDPAEFADILDTGFSESKLALIPQESDSVVIGDMERTRFNSVRALFLLGCNEGVIPASKSDGGLLSDADRSIFAENDIELSPTKRESAYLNEFYLYLNLTKPTEKLFLSCHRTTADKKPGRPSYFVGKLLKLFEGLKIKELRSGDPELLPGSDGGRRAAADILRTAAEQGSKPGEKEQLLYEVSTNDSAAYGRLLDSAFRMPIPERITPENAAKLYGDTLTGSVSMLETYARCAFSHFVEYGLRLEEPAEYEVGSLEIGNIYHKALECYCVALKSQKIRWHDVDAGTKEELEEKALEEAFAEYGGVLDDSSRNTYIKKRVARVLKRTVDTIEKQIKAGEFEPEFFEKGFKHAGEFMCFEGRIDRMDTFERNGKKYLRVVDYKSGKKDFDLDKLLYGLQIQLAVYMKEGLRELEENGREAAVTGMYYYIIEDPLIEVKDDDTDIEGKVNSELRMKGPSLDGAEMLRLHDTELVDDTGEYRQASYRSPVIAAGTTKEGKLTAATKVYTGEQFASLGDYVDEQIKERSGEILQGRIDVDPYELGKENACENCPYGGICGFDVRLGSKFRRLKKLTEDEIWQRINGVKNSGT